MASWEGMTKAERSAEMKRRMAKSRKKQAAQTAATLPPNSQVEAAQPQAIDYQKLHYDLKVNYENLRGRFFSMKSRIAGILISEEF
jgi:hypothetical protein